VKLSISGCYNSFLLCILHNGARVIWLCSINFPIDEDVSHRIKVGWLKWYQVSSVLCDLRVPLKLKDKFYWITIQPVILYGAECWPTKRRHVQQLNIAEMHMLRWICGHTRRDHVRNDDIRERLGMTPVKKLMQHCLKWFGHI
jgi:hypothetical protein